MFNDISKNLHSTFERMSAEKIACFATGISSLSYHDVIESPIAKLLHAWELLELSPVRHFELRGESVQCCCVRLTMRGILSVQSLENEMGLIPKDSGKMPDFFEASLSDKNHPYKFVMHERRLRKELAQTPKRAALVLDRYDRTFEEDLKRHHASPRSLKMRST